ncbi:MAG: hypothetical protein JXR83_15195, partial [Deltaproteobacteria bacterium]|nr:hypothetical protein [Deltaproteobacteria bacterium]
ASPTSRAYIVLEDGSGTLRDKVSADFVEPGAIRLQVQDLRIGLDATALGAATLTFSYEELGIAACMINGLNALTCLSCYLAGWPAVDNSGLICSYPLPSNCCRDKNKLTNVDVGCDVVDGNLASNPRYPGYAISLSIDLLLRPSVTNANCLQNARRCLFVDTTFNPLTDFQIDSVEIDVRNSDWVEDHISGDTLCTDDDSIFGTVVEISESAECDAICPVLDTSMGVISDVDDFLGPILDVAAGAVVSALLDSIFASLNGQPLDAQNRISVADAAGGVGSLAAANDLGLSLQPSTGTFRVNCPGGSTPCGVRFRGMDLVMSSGFEAVHDVAAGRPAPHPCVRPIEGIDFVRLYGSAAFEAPVATPLTGEFAVSGSLPHVYHMAGSVARASLNQLGFAAYNAGLLCLELGSEEIHALSNGSFMLTAGAIDLLAGGALGQFVDPLAPALLVTAPEQPPLFTLGAGSTADPLLRVDLSRLRLGLYVMMYERLVRIFEVAGDVRVGFSLTADQASHRLQFEIVEGPTLGNFEELYNEMLPFADFAELLPALIDVALGALIEDGLTIDYDITPLLEQALGVPLGLELAGVETNGPAGRREFLNLYFDLVAQQRGRARQLGLFSDLKVDEDPGLLSLGADGSWRPTGRVRLVDRFARLDPDDLYRYRVDGGFWRSWVRPDADGVLELSSPLLKLLGRHVIEVRGRRAGETGSAEAVPARIEVDLDPLAPELRLYRGVDGAVVAVGRDLATPAELLEYAFAVDGAKWGEWTARAQLDRERLANATMVSARCRDLAGNLSPEVRLRLR